MALALWLTGCGGKTNTERGKTRDERTQKRVEQNRVGVMVADRMWCSMAAKF
jgi:hypothetical protein